MDSRFQTIKQFCKNAYHQKPVFGFWFGTTIGWMGLSLLAANAFLSLIPFVGMMPLILLTLTGFVLSVVTIPFFDNVSDSVCKQLAESYVGLFNAILRCVTGALSGVWSVFAGRFERAAKYLASTWAALMHWFEPRSTEIIENAMMGFAFFCPVSMILHFALPEIIPSLVPYLAVVFISTLLMVGLAVIAASQSNPELKRVGSSPQLSDFRHAHIANFVVIDERDEFMDDDVLIEDLDEINESPKAASPTG